MVHSPKVTGNLKQAAYSPFLWYLQQQSAQKNETLYYWCDPLSACSVALSCLTLHDPMDHSLAVHGILLARIPKYSSFPIACPRGSSRPRDRTPICIPSIPPAPPAEPGLPQTHRDSVLSITQYTGGHELLTCRSYSLYRYTEAIIFITVTSFQHLKSENFLP